LIFGVFLDEVRDRGGATAAAGPCDIDIKARPAHVDAKIDRADGARLTDDLIDQRQIIGGLEFQMAGIANSAQFYGGERFDLHIGYSC
jgi:hypothetical protein